MMKNISLLGSTGSIGTQTLDVARMHGLGVLALAANKNVKLLEQQIREFSPKLVAVMDEAAALDLRGRTRDLDYRLVTGIDGVCEAAICDGADVVLNSVVGMVGLRPTLAAIRAKKTLALANKETLVTGGELVMNAAKKAGVRILPVDSEHSAIFQCLNAAPPQRRLKKILLTASGGPFFGQTKEQLRNVTIEQALRHPNWSMGAKITIDSATMMNKGLEVIEAVHLFDVSPRDIEVVVHRESLLHSAVEFDDGAVIAQIGVPDMRLPIQYALTYPDRLPTPGDRLDLFKAAKMTFARPDYDTFTCLGTCIEAISSGGLKPTAANGANEQAVELFLDGKIGFLQIGELVSAATEAQPVGKISGVDDILQADSAAREFVLSKI
jgi:1-deoxy-D-xylulose-5-phosphate reductoisomerase